MGKKGAFYFKNNNSIELLIVISLIMMGIIYYLPLFLVEGIIRSDDTTFHIGRLVGLSNVWLSPVNFNSFGNNGSMVNIFYPWLTMYPMWLSYKLTKSYVIGYKLYYTLLSIATLIVAYKSMHEITKEKGGSYVFAVLYTFSSYRYADIFNRGALGEAIALTFLPLVLVGIYNICEGDYKRWGKLALGMTLLAYSHILSLLMTAAFIGAIYIVSLAYQEQRKERLISFIKASLLSAGLSVGMLAPMLQQYYRNDLFTPEGNGDTLSNSAYSLKRLFEFSIENNASGRGVGVLTAVATCIAIILIVARIITRLFSKDKMDNAEQFALLMLCIGICLFVATSDILPWQLIGDKTFIGTLQFVWRLNAYSILALTAAFSMLISKPMKSSRLTALVVVVAVVISSLGIHTYNIYTRKGMNDFKNNIKESDIATWPSGNVDYAPIQAKTYRDINGKTMEYILVNGKAMEEDPEIVNGGTIYRHVFFTNGETGTIDIPVFCFSGEVVGLNGQSIEHQLSKRGTTEIVLSDVDTAVVEISYKYTALARVSQLTSFIILMVYICYITLNLRANKSKV